MNSYLSYQGEVDALFGELGWKYWSPLSIMGRLTEEMGELAREVNHHYGDKKKRADEDVGDIACEIGDIIYTLVCFSNDNGYLLDRAYCIASWRRSEWGAASMLAIFIELTWIAGAFAKEVNRCYGKDDKAQKLPILAVEQAMGDVLRVLECLANRLGVSLDVAIRKTIDKVSVRDKDRFPKGI